MGSGKQQETEDRVSNRKCVVEEKTGRVQGKHI